MSNRMHEQLEFAKFDPAPEGTSEYDDNMKGFFLAGAPMMGATMQGSGSGAKFKTIQFQIIGNRADLTTLTNLTIQNSKKPTKCTHISALTITGKRKMLEQTVYEGIEFEDAFAMFPEGEQETMITVACTFTKAERQSKAYGPDGKEKPSAKMSLDLTKGIFK
jgi:hypothetical protein